MVLMQKTQLFSCSTFKFSGKYTDPWLQDRSDENQKKKCPQTGGDTDNLFFYLPGNVLKEPVSEMLPGG